MMVNVGEWCEMTANDNGEAGDNHLDCDDNGNNPSNVISLIHTPPSGLLERCVHM